MLVVGLTGGIGSGKSLVSAAFADLGVPIVDADIVAREAVAPGQPALKAIEAHFGPEVMSNDGELNRAALRSVIFNDPQQKLWLESLLHPRVRQMIEEQLANAPGPYAILVSPLLIETRQTELVSKVVVVDALEDTQLQRAKARDDSSIPLIQRIMASQLSRQDRLAYADYIVDNEGSVENTQEQVKALHQTFLDLTK